MNQKPPQAQGSILTAYFIITLALFLSNGYFSVLSFFLLACGILLLFSPASLFTYPAKHEPRFLHGLLALFTLMMLVKLNWFFAIYPVAQERFRHLHVVYNPHGKALLLSLLAAPCAGSLLFFFAKPVQRYSRIFFFSMSFFYLAVMGITLCAFDNPPIDIFDLFQKSGEGLRRGENPYSLLFPNMYYGTGMKIITHDPRYYKPVLDSMDYFPGIFPFLYINIWGDVRFLFLLFHFLSALLLFLHSRGQGKGALWALVHLYNPIHVYLLVFSFLDPLLVVSLCAATFCLVGKKETLLPFALGYMLCVKQYGIFLLFPFLQFLKKQTILLTLLVASAFLGIAFLWSPADFVHDSLLRPLETHPRADALNLLTFLWHIGKTPSSWNGVSFLSPALFLLIPFKKANIRQALILTGKAYFFLFVFYRVTFFNYYCFALSFLPLSQCVPPASDFDS